jgi:hypothetical protein
MGKSKAPPAPDYTGLAREQGVANIDAARLSGRLSNPNVFSPFGQRTVQYGGENDPNRFNAGAYQEAMRQYRSDFEKWRLDPSGRPREFGTDNMPIKPTREMFMGGFDPDMVTVRDELTPEAQALLDQQLRISQQFGDVAEGGLGRVARAMGQDFDPSILPEVRGIDPTAFDRQISPNVMMRDFDPSILPEVRGIDPTAFDRQISPDVMMRERVEQALMDRLNPQLQQARQAQEDALLLQGQGRGGRAWQTAQQDLSRRESDALTSAILGAGQEQQRQFAMDLANLQAQRQGQEALYGLQSANRKRALQEALALRQFAGQEQQRQFAMDLANLQAQRQGQEALYGLQSATRGRALQEALALRQLPLSEINALRTGSQPNIPQFQPFQGSQVQAAPVFQAGQMGYQAALNQANAQNAAQSSLFGGLTGLGGSVLGAAGAAGGFGPLFSGIF